MSYGTGHYKTPLTQARIHGVQAKMQTFDFFYGLNLCILVLSHSNNLSSTLQNPDLCAAEAQNVAKLTINTLATLRSDQDASLFYSKILKIAQDNPVVGDPKLPRKRKVPRKIDHGRAAAEHHTDPETFYRQIYYETVDLITSRIKDCFDQEDFKIYVACEQLIINSLNDNDT